MADEMIVKELDQVVVRFSGDSGDGMQLAGNIFSNISATVGNDISTFPDYPADIRAPQGSLTGVSGFQVHIGAGKVFTPGDKCDVLVAMNAAALKTQYKFAKSTACIIIDTDCFQKSDLDKAAFKTDNPIEEMGIKQDVIAAPISQMVKDCLADTGMDNKSMLKCRNMFALGLVCWLFNRDLAVAENFLREKFAKKPQIAEANIKVIHAGYDYGHNTHASVDHTYKVETKSKVPGKYMDISGNKATAYGLIAAAEKAGLRLFLGSYPITPATDILHELSKHKSLGVTTVQCEDEISGCATAIGASFEGALLRIYFDFERREAVQKAGSEDVVVEDQYVCENVDVEGEHDYDSIVSAIIMERYDANKRDAIFANLEMARDMASELDEGKRAEYLKEYTDYQSYRIKAKEIAKEVLAKLK